MYLKDNYSALNIKHNNAFIQYKYVKCTRCNNEFTDTDPRAYIYKACNRCWAEWIKYSIIVINDLRLDMSIKEHRIMLKRYEQGFFGIKAEGVKDLTKEEERTPDKL